MQYDKWNRALLTVSLMCFLCDPRHSEGAGVTVVTHGLNGNIDTWVTAMTEAIPDHPNFPGSQYTSYEVYFILTNNSYVPTWRRISGESPITTDSGEIFVNLDWRQLADNNSYDTYDVAWTISSVFSDTNFIPELQGHALCEFPMHLIGFSRGGSLVSEISRNFGTNGIWVDHLTTLDPHPLNNDGFYDWLFFRVVDAPVRTYANVLFHDNYWQDRSIFRGEPVAGAYVRKLENLSGGYAGIGDEHFNVHLWYHGTIDLYTPATDGTADVTDIERELWWSPEESFGINSGFIYSRIGGVERISTNRPAGPGTAQVLEGYNRRYDLGAGIADNRANLPQVTGRWPNLIEVRCSTHNIGFHTNNTVSFYYQWAGTGQATVEAFLDEDSNPFTGNERYLAEKIVNPTGADSIGTNSLSFNLNSVDVTAGLHNLFIKISDQGRRRYLYLTRPLVIAGDRPIRLRLSFTPMGLTHVDVLANKGQTIILESSYDLLNWMPIATNTMQLAAWRHSEPTQVVPKRFFRVYHR